jgi:hypothetical protein
MAKVIRGASITIGEKSYPLPDVMEEIRIRWARALAVSR